MLITIADAIVYFNAQTASLDDWNNYSDAMKVLKLINKDKL